MSGFERGSQPPVPAEPDALLNLRENVAAGRSREQLAAVVAVLSILVVAAYLLGLELSGVDGGISLRSVTLGAQLLRVTWAGALGVQGLELGGRDATALVTVALAAVTSWLAFETQRLARGARREIRTLERQASIAAEQLTEFRKQGRHRPQLEWEQWSLTYHWEPGAETVGPKTGKKVRIDLGLKAPNFGGAAFMMEADLKGDGAITYELPRKLIPSNREFLMTISFDAVGGTPFRYETVLAQRYRSWDQDEEFTGYVLIALASDWFDDNDPRTAVIPLQRPTQIDGDAKYWASDTFRKYDGDIAAKKKNLPSG